MDFESFDLEESSPACGDLIEGIDLSQDLSNRLSLHYGLVDYTDHRLMHRVVIQGDKPV